MLRQLLSYLMVMAVTAAGMIPAGWMPSASGDGKILLVICTGDGVREEWIDTGAPAAPNVPMEDRSCPFAALATAAVLPESAAALGAEHWVAALWAREPFTHHTAGFHWRYDARGPPALS